ncbi:hypothetical protein [Pararhizobium sp. DWP3-4]|uniref:hypothetical protein n=1 Tax=Pararhizobium sp. DWP3-4 TaxID=2804565 RepID=UPI003CEC97BC
MRSPWQLIKGLVSRSKSEEGGATADEAVATSDPQVEVFEQRNAPQRELEAQPGTNTQSTAGGNETDRHLPSIDADAQQPLPAVQTNPLPLRVAGNVGRDRPAPVVPLDGKGGSGTLATGLNERRAKAPHARGNLGKRTIVKTAVEQPVATKTTAVDEAAELDLEIKNLRLELSAKLLEQNTQLRRMIERYGDK